MRLSGGKQGKRAEEGRQGQGFCQKGPCTPGLYPRLEEASVRSLAQASSPSRATGESAVRTTAQGDPGRPDLHGRGCQGQVTLGTTFRRYRAAQVSGWIAGTALCTWK